ncbi:hypothetical protein SEVIR_9G031000v4 [Setaria viridis]|uniref:Uncharacterized protein n=1 Tax=Setaria viridis TaxID=4556 RepID=A0A4U6SQM3_SETVI|nr:scarecrow-like protein 30 [Setaria viridis]XP_034572106.1 scarecrow-like protein 30 [Setaria viridis]TKV90461.1 hypothetical protein SEVIR_9G031000v2 [Setaria viridis]
MMDPGSRDNIDFGDQLSTPNPPTPHMINFSLQQQSQVQYFPSYGFHSHNPPVSSHPSPPWVMLGCTTPSPASTTTTELDSADDADDAVLAYINQFLLEDEDDESYPVSSASVEDSALLAVEKPFVDILKSAKPIMAQAYEMKSWMTDDCESTGSRGFHDVVTSNQNSSQLPSQMVVECSVGATHKGRKTKNPHDDDLEMEERKSKQLALCDEETVREMFDKVLLCTDANCEFHSPMPAEAQINGRYVKGSGNRRGRRKGRSGTSPEEEAVDLTTLLIHCAQAAAIDDHRNANELLKQIRKHSSATGDAGQRLAHYFANGLEARLAGTGSSIYRSLTSKRTSTGEMLRAFGLYVKACSFRLISHYVANTTILNASKSEARLHIIDYGVQYGFQWPVLMQRLSKRCGGPPSLRITGIDFPLPGFRPAERIEATGRRLHEYARMFNIPFEYQAIASKWDTIQVEDLKIKSDEYLVVNCLYRMRNMMDETVTDDSPRTRVLNTIRKLNPHLFVHGIVNGTYNAPFFVTRFKEAMFFFSSIFDMLEANASRMDEHRLLIESEFFGREALNVIACEGTERIERPETYKQWQMRNLRAGFRQLRLNEEIMKRARYKVSKSYHRDFLVDEDNKWMLQGWKGRIIFALSAWTS